MKALVVYDSFFGNTEIIAQAISKALNAPAVRVGEMKPEQLQGVELMIVGSPTRAFSPTAAIKSFLKALPAKSLRGVKSAAFDTRMDIGEVNVPILKFMAGIFGYAAPAVAKLLMKKGASSCAQPEGYFVKASEGPLKNGEADRAASWAMQLAKNP